MKPTFSATEILLLSRIGKGPTIGYQLSQQLALKTATVYAVCERLRMRGLVRVDETEKRGKRTFVFTITADGRIRLRQLIRTWIAWRDDIDKAIGGR